jgi:hypothetical protein
MWILAYGYFTFIIKWFYSYCVWEGGLSEVVEKEKNIDWRVKRGWDWVGNWTFSQQNFLEQLGMSWDFHTLSYVQYPMF